MMPEIAVVAPEYRELHEMYCRCTEIREALLERIEGHQTSPLLGELLGRYAGIGNEVAALVIFLQTQLPDDPALFEKWREAQKQGGG